MRTKKLYSKFIYDLERMDPIKMIAVAFFDKDLPHGIEHSYVWEKFLKRHDSLVRIYLNAYSDYFGEYKRWLREKADPNCENVEKPLTDYEKVIKYLTEGIENGQTN